MNRVSIEQTVFVYLHATLRENSLTVPLVSHATPHAMAVVKKLLPIVTNVNEDFSKMKINYAFNRKLKEKILNAVEALFWVPTSDVFAKIRVCITIKLKKHVLSLTSPNVLEDTCQVVNAWNVLEHKMKQTKPDASFVLVTRYRIA